MTTLPLNGVRLRVRLVEVEVSRLKLERENPRLLRISDREEFENGLPEKIILPIDPQFLCGDPVGCEGSGRHRYHSCPFCSVCEAGLSTACSFFIADCCASRRRRTMTLEKMWAASGDQDPPSYFQALLEVQIRDGIAVKTTCLFVRRLRASGL